MMEKKKSKERKSSEKSIGKAQIEASIVKLLLSNDDNGTVNGLSDGDILEADHARQSTLSQPSRKSVKLKDSNSRANVKTKKIKKDGSHKKKIFQSSTEWEIDESLSEVTAERFDEISSIDEDCSRGMKKWFSEYKDSRPALKMLEQRIDELITAYEEKQEQERKEREALATEGGWTVVAHHKGRKKTTDSESGITMGSVAPAAAVDKLGKKKNKEVVVDFYRFQKREAQRNEVMMLHSKFEQDKKRIQQLRAARKFWPY